MRYRRLYVTLAACLAGGLAAAQQVPANWDSATAYTGGGLIRGSDGNYYRCLKNNTNQNPTKDPHQYWELYYVRTATILGVAANGPRFKDLVSAFAMCSSATISPNASVMILISTAGGNFSESFSGPFSLNAVSGDRIGIVGDKQNNITLTFTVSAGFVLDSGHSFGALSNMKVFGNGSSGNLTGILVDGGANLLSTNAYVAAFQDGIKADHHSNIVCENASVSSVTDAGILADHHSHIDAANADIGGGGQANYGMMANNDSHLEAQNSQVKFAYVSGYVAENMSLLDATGANATQDKVGYVAQHWSTLLGINATAIQNTCGFQVTTGGHINATGCTNSMNTTNFNTSPNAATPDLSYIVN